MNVLEALRHVNDVLSVLLPIGDTAWDGSE